MNKGRPTGTRDAVIAMLKEGPQTTEGMAAKLGLVNQSTWLIVRDLRKARKPVRIVAWVRPQSGKSLVPAYEYGPGYDVLLEKPEAEDGPSEVTVPHRDWPVVAMFGERGMANSRMENRA